MFKFFLVLMILLNSACAPSPQSTTVMITNLASSSGGSGSILETSKSASIVLTNGHVCDVVKNGGLVHADSGVYFINSYKKSNLHDLCLIQVANDLHTSARISSFVPRPFDDALVSGHPHLMPTIITRGHFSGKQILQVMISTRACTEADLANPNTALFCILLGKLPVIKSYEAVALSATIQPGSSGSAVYNSAGYISAVIFAGSGDLAYGYAVPFEYVYNFLTQEAATLNYVPVNTQLDLSADSGNESTRSFSAKAREICNYSDEASLKNICRLVQNSSVISDLIERR